MTIELFSLEEKVNQGEVRNEEYLATTLLIRILGK